MLLNCQKGQMPSTIKREFGFIEEFTKGMCISACTCMLDNRYDSRSHLSKTAYFIHATLPLIFHISPFLGVRSFYKGIGPTLLRAFPACAALFLAYEKSKKMMSEGFSWEMQYSIICSLCCWVFVASIDVQFTRINVCSGCEEFWWPPSLNRPCYRPCYKVSTLVYVW